MSEGLGDGFPEPDFGMTGVIDDLIEPDWHGADRLLDHDWNRRDGLLEPDFAEIHRDDLLAPLQDASRSRAVSLVEPHRDDLLTPDFLNVHGDDLLAPDFE